MNQNEIAKEIHQVMKTKGYHNNPKSDEHLLMLVITEVAELIEADRNSKVADIIKLNNLMEKPIDESKFNKKFIDTFENLIKGTREEEFADIAIRLYDLAGRNEFNLTKFSSVLKDNFNDMSYTEKCYDFIKMFVGFKTTRARVCWALTYIYDWTEFENIDLNYMIHLKMKYNKLKTSNKKY